MKDVGQGDASLIKSSPPGDRAHRPGLRHLVLLGQRHRLHPVSPVQGLGEVEQADVVGDGWGVNKD